MFLAKTTGGYPFKVTFPAASIFGHPFTYKVGITDRGYGSLDGSKYSTKRTFESPDAEASITSFTLLR